MAQVQSPEEMLNDELVWVPAGTGGLLAHVENKQRCLCAAAVHPAQYGSLCLGWTLWHGQSQLVLGDSNIFALIAFIFCSCKISPIPHVCQNGCIG